MAFFTEAKNLTKYIKIIFQKITDRQQIYRIVFIIIQEKMTVFTY